MTFEEWHRSIINQLDKIYSAGESKAIARRVFEDVLKLNSVDFFLKTKLDVPADVKAKLEETLKRLIQHEPIQYITGIADFYGMKFKVNRDVLIPRSETEELVKWIISDVKNSFNNQKPSILDIGTGSGCIAISLKKNIANANVLAIDVSKDALTLAHENAVINKVEVNFSEKDILIPDTSGALKYDIIVSNPPYIKNSEQEKMSPNVLNYEPHSALFVPDDDALLFYKYISRFALTHLNIGGYLYFEINESLGAAVTHLLTDFGFNNIILQKDINGKERMTRCIYSAKIAGS